MTLTVESNLANASLRRQTFAPSASIYRARKPPTEPQPNKPIRTLLISVPFRDRKSSAPFHGTEPSSTELHRDSAGGRDSGKEGAAPFLPAPDHRRQGARESLRHVNAAHVATCKHECRCSRVDDRLSLKRSSADAFVLGQDRPAARSNDRKPRLVRGRLVETRFDQDVDRCAFSSQPLRYDFGAQAVVHEERRRIKRPRHSSPSARRSPRPP